MSFGLVEQRDSQHIPINGTPKPVLALGAAALCPSSRVLLL